MKNKHEYSKKKCMRELRFNMIENKPTGSVIKLSNDWISGKSILKYKYEYEGSVNREVKTYQMSSEELDKYFKSRYGSTYQL